MFNSSRGAKCVYWSMAGKFAPQLLLFLACFAGIVCGCQWAAAQATEPAPHIITALDTAVIAAPDAPNYVVVANVLVKGNKLTKKPIILREMDFAAGDTLPLATLETVLERNRNQIYNTRLFNDVSIKISEQHSILITFTIEVEERWYILPAPIFELADRNFNEWWVTHKRSLKRTEYGFLFVHDNFRGRKELLKMMVQLGFTRKIELSYVIPFVDRQRKTGINPFISYITNREVQYLTLNNKQQFYRDEEQILRMRFRCGIGLTRRPNIRTSHYLNLTWFYNTIADTLEQLNPNYFMNGKTRQQFLQARYEFTEDHRDIAAYPLKGYYLWLQAAKSGWGETDDINQLWFSAKLTQYQPLGKHWFAMASIRGKTSFPTQQPYFNQEGLGFGGNTLRGYEYYIIDGQHYAMLRTSLKYEVLKLKLINPVFKRLSQFRTIPFAVYLKTYAETAYVKDRFYYQQNPLTNTWLASTGIGFDIFTLYDKVFSLEYSINRYDRKGGLFISFGLVYD